MNRSRIGIAIGPRTWFGNQHGNNVSTGGIVQDNQFTGAFSYGIAMSSATNFTVDNNVLIGNTSFIGVRGPDCTAKSPIPPPAAFVMDLDHVQTSTTQLSFASITHDNSLVSCVVPPTGGDFWPFRGNPDSNSPPIGPPDLSDKFELPVGWHDRGIDTGSIMLVMFSMVFITWFVRKWPMKRRLLARLFPRYTVGYTRLRSDPYSNIP